MSMPACGGKRTPGSLQRANRRRRRGHLLQYVSLAVLNSLFTPLWGDCTGLHVDGGCHSREIMGAGGPPARTDTTSEIGGLRMAS